MAAKIQEITDTIIARLKEGTMPWERPWKTQTTRPLRHCGTPYKGFNVLWLWMLADMKGYSSPYWMTYNQAQALAAQVRKGERGTLSYFYKPIFANDSDEDDPEIKSWILRTFRVYNADQIERLPANYHPDPVEVSETVRTGAIDAFFAKMPQVEHGGNQAFYDLVNDRIRLPHRSAFQDDDLYATTRAHETLHWTGHETRLNRTFGKRFGDEAYAFEELIACLGQALIGAELGLPTSHLYNHASYISSWIKVLEGDHTAILTAARHADAAVQYLLELAETTPTVDAETDPQDVPAFKAAA